MVQKILVAGAALFLLFVAGNVAGETSAAANLQSIALVLGGTILTGFLAYPMKTIRGIPGRLITLLRGDGPDREALVRQMENLALVRRKHGNRELEAEGAKTDHLFLRKGIELVVDGYDRYEIRNVMEKEFELYFSRRQSEVGFLNTMAKVAPIFGFVGTLVGLINVLGHMDDPSHIGRGMAVALLTTFYGLLIANFLFLPTAKKLSEYVKSEAMLLNIIMEAIVDISAQRNSRAVAHRLQSYLGAEGLSSAHGVDIDPDRQGTPVVRSLHPINSGK